MRLELRAGNIFGLWNMSFDSMIIPNGNADFEFFKHKCFQQSEGEKVGVRCLS